ncbi:sel1 repeat family protein [Geodermatophilus sp. SYSU D00804]
MSAIDDDYWEILKASGVAPRHDPAMLRQLHQLYTARAIEMVKASSRRSGREVTVGPATDVFAPETVATAHGAVILLGEELLFAIYKIAWVIGAAMPYDTEPAGPPVLSPEEAAELIRDLVAGGLARRPPPETVGPRFLRARRGEFVNVLAQQAIDFLIAHELAHVVCGHLDRDLADVDISDEISGGVDLHSWERELEADVVGADLVRPLASDHPLAVELGATLVFEVMESAYGWRAGSGHEGHLRLGEAAGLMSHPPAAARRVEVVRALHPDGAPELAELDDVVQLMRRSRGQEPPTPTEEGEQVLGQLGVLMLSADVGWLDGYSNLPGDGGRLKAVDYFGIWESVREDPDRTRGTIARIAMEILWAGSASDEGLRNILGVVMGFYIMTNLRSQEAAELWAQVRVAVPDLDDVLAEAFFKHDLPRARLSGPDRGEGASATSGGGLFATLAHSLGLFLSQAVRPPDLMRARGWYERAAVMGDTGAMRDLGVLLSRQFFPRDLPAARTWLERAAAHGSVEAMHDLGVLLSDRWAPPDFPSARRWLEKAAEAADADAMYNLGVLAERITPRDDAGARAWYGKAAAAGHPLALRSLAGLLARSAPDELAAARVTWEEAARAGDGNAAYAVGFITGTLVHPPDVSAAKTWFRWAADAGHLGAMRELGVLHVTQDDPPDLVSARALWEKAAEGGDLEAMRELGHLLARLWEPPDIDAARAWWEKAATAGDTASIHNLGVFFAEVVDPPDLVSARDWYVRAVDAGSADAAYNLGALFEMRWQPPDPVAARRWFERAAAMGHGLAMWRLAWLLADSDPPDLPGARRWLEAAAGTGNVHAMHDLGLFFNDVWQPPDLDLARHWWEKAAAAGEPDSMHNLGVLLADRLEKPDLEAAVRWYERAAAEGHVGAMHNLGVLLATRVDPPQLVAARSYWEKAAAAGRSDSMHNLGAMFATMWEPPDLEAARHWLRLAARAGFAPSEEVLAQLDGE